MKSAVFFIFLYNISDTSTINQAKKVQAKLCKDLLLSSITLKMLNIALNHINLA